MPRYAWALKGYFKDTDPQVVGERIETLIAEHDGYLTSEEILADAKKHDSPLHEMFEWKDDLAADRHRKQTARTMLNTLTTGPNQKQRTRAFVYARSAKHGRKVYQSIRTAMQDRDTRAEVIQNSLTQLTRWIGHWGGRRELRFVQRTVEKLRHRIEVELMTASGVSR